MLKKKSVFSYLNLWPTIISCVMTSLKGDIMEPTHTGKMFHLAGTIQKG